MSAEMITVVVNGESREIPASSTVESLLTDCQMTTAICAVEINRDVVARRDHATHMLTEGDAVEIVSLVGGG